MLSGAKLARYHIGSTLQLIYQVVGLRPDNEPSKELAVIIAKYIQKTFHYFTPNDLYQAFEFALQDKFKCGKDHLEHYQIMDVKYLTRVFSHYAKYRRRMIQEMKSKNVENSIEGRINTIIESRQKNDQAVKQMLYDSFNAVCNGRQDANVMEEHFYWLVDIGLITVTASKWNRLVVEALKLSERKTNYNTIKVQVLKDIALSEFQEWDIKGINPMMVRFGDVSYISPNDTMELSKLKSIKNV